MSIELIISGDDPVAVAQDIQMFIGAIQRQSHPLTSSDASVGQARTGSAQTATETKAQSSDNASDDGEEVKPVRATEKKLKDAAKMAEKGEELPPEWAANPKIQEAYEQAQEDTDPSDDDTDGEKETDELAGDDDTDDGEEDLTGSSEEPRKAGEVSKDEIMELIGISIKELGQPETKELIKKATGGEVIPGAKMDEKQRAKAYNLIQDALEKANDD